MDTVAIDTYIAKGVSLVEKELKVLYDYLKSIKVIDRYKINIRRKVGETRVYVDTKYTDPDTYVRRGSGAEMDANNSIIPLSFGASVPQGSLGVLAVVRRYMRCNINYYKVHGEALTLSAETVNVGTDVLRADMKKFMVEKDIIEDRKVFEFIDEWVDACVSGIKEYLNIFKDAKE
jgi:hypothetical protein